MSCPKKFVCLLVLASILISIKNQTLSCQSIESDQTEWDKVSISSLNEDDWKKMGVRLELSEFKPLDDAKLITRVEKVVIGKGQEFIASASATNLEGLTCAFMDKSVPKCKTDIAPCAFHNNQNAAQGNFPIVATITSERAYVRNCVLVRFSKDCNVQTVKDVMQKFKLEFHKDYAASPLLGLFAFWMSDDVLDEFQSEIFSRSSSLKTEYDQTFCDCDSAELKQLCESRIEHMNKYEWAGGSLIELCDRILQMKGVESALPNITIQPSNLDTKLRAIDDSAMESYQMEILNRYKPDDFGNVENVTIHVLDLGFDPHEALENVPALPLKPVGENCYHGTAVLGVLGAREKGMAGKKWISGVCRSEVNYAFYPARDLHTVVTILAKIMNEERGDRDVTIVNCSFEILQIKIAVNLENDLDREQTYRDELTRRYQEICLQNSPALQSILSELEEKNVLVISAAGNVAGLESRFSSVTNYCGLELNCKNVIVVGGHDQARKVSESCVNAHIYAPNQFVTLDTRTDEKMAVNCGTSLSTPLVAAVFANMFSVDRNLKIHEAIDLILANSPRKNGIKCIDPEAIYKAHKDQMTKR